MNERQYILNILEHNKQSHQNRMNAIKACHEQHLSMGQQTAAHQNCFEQQVEEEESSIKEYDQCIEWIENVNESEVFL